MRRRHFLLENVKLSSLTGIESWPTSHALPRLLLSTIALLETLAVGHKTVSD